VQSLVWIHLTTQCSVGLSGVIFALLVIHCHLAASPVSVLGFLQLNARIYPVVMLFLMQLILPNVRPPNCERDRYMDGEREREREREPLPT